MVNKVQNIQILFDLMNGLLGPKTEEVILKKNMPIFIKKLNCFMACVVKNDTGVKYLLPLVLRKNKDWLTILEDLKIKQKSLEGTNIQNVDCCEYNFFGNYYYKFTIEDYGFLILGRKKPFDKFFTLELKPVINFLGKSLLLVTERVKLENSQKELYREKELLRTIVDNIPMHVYAKGTNKKWILSNKAELKYLGLKSEKDAIGKKREELFKDIDIANTDKQDDEVFAGKTIINKETSHIKNNKKAWFLQSKIPLRNEKGQISGFVGIAMNITDQKKSEANILDVNNRLKKQEERYRNLISNINLSLLEVDLDGNFTFWNKAFEKMSGYTENELRKMKFSDLLVSKKYTSFVEAKRKSRFLGKVDSYEITARKKSGQLMWLHVSGAPNYNDEGDLIGTLSVQLDITDRKKLEQELEKALIDSQNISEAKELFLTNMSHEIRTPLNGIMGMIRAIGEEKISDQQNGYLKSAMKASRHLLSVVNSILDITKIEAGEFKMNYNHFSLLDLLNDIIAILNPQSKQKGIGLELKMDEDLTSVFIGDELRIRQILINLIGNSIKFTERGKVTITCSIKSTDEGYSRLCFTISDTGIGMDEEYLAVLFEKFQQEDASISRRYGGTGLGMFISKQLLDLMGGNIEVASKKGVGSEFKVFMPLQKGDHSKVEKKQLQTNSSLLENIKILLVEDNEMNRMVACNSLRQWNMQITEAANGIDVVELLKKETFDIILMDIQMPEMNGMEATQIIRKELNIHTPIIALSANAFKSEIIKCRSIGMDDYITKPFEEQDLFNMLVKHVKIIKEPKNKQGVDKKYDLSKLIEMSRGNEDFVQKMLHLFIDTIPTSISDMNVMLSEGNIRGVKKIAHRIKPSLNNMGIVVVAKDIFAIENYNGNDTTIETLNGLVLNVTQILNSIVTSIKKFEIK